MVGKLALFKPRSICPICDRLIPAKCARPSCDMLSFFRRALTATLKCSVIDIVSVASLQV